LIKPHDIIKECAELALAGRGFNKTNPLVGAIVVKSDKVIASGYHRKFGKEHAEINALKEAGALASGADLYVTLEPCSQVGKTPPCCVEIVKSGIKRVFIGVVDPNPVNMGKGISHLLDNNIQVFLGFDEELCAAIIEDFTKSVLHKIPYFSVKIAQSLDGKIATSAGDSKWITNKSCREYVHYLRSISDAVLVGINTVINDDPFLNVRSLTDVPDPLKIVLDKDLRIPVESNLVKKSAEKLIIAAGNDINSIKRIILEDKGVTIIKCDVVDNKHINVIELSKALFKRNIMNVLIEGGSEVFGTFIDKDMVDKIYLFMAPIIIGGKESISSVGGRGVPLIKRAKVVDFLEIKSIEDNFLCTGKLKDYTHYVLEKTDELRNRCLRA